MSPEGLTPRPFKACRAEPAEPGLQAGDPISSQEDRVPGLRVEQIWSSDPRQINDSSLMAHSLFLMVTWTTYERLPMIRAPEAAFLHRFLPAEVQQHQMTVLALGLVVDHVHLVVRAQPVMNIPQLVQHLKGGSARIANKTIDGPGLRWAPGYSVESVSPDALSRAIHYVRTQNRRHPERVIPGLKD